MVKKLLLLHKKHKILSSKSPISHKNLFPMQHKIKMIILILVYLPPVSINTHAMIFTHPGTLYSKEELETAKEKLNAKNQFLMTNVNKVKKMALPHGEGLRTVNAKNNKEALHIRREALKAQANALLWYLTSEEKYAQEAITIFKAWDFFEGFTSGTEQDFLLAGWTGALFATAADIMLSYDKWPTEKIALLRKMFKRAYYPNIQTASSWNGNVDLTQIDAMMSIAVFNEDSLLFTDGIDRLNKRLPAYIYLTTDKEIPSIKGDWDNIERFWHSPSEWPNGLTQESCRDNNHHTQFGLASAIHAAETAWHQGIDLYGLHEKRYIAAMELAASQLLNKKMGKICPREISTPNVFHTWEIGYYHFHKRMGLELKNTKKLIQTHVRKHGKTKLNIFNETLIHGGLH